MAPTKGVDDSIKYLLLVIKHAEFKPKGRAVANEAGINNAKNAQKKFKKLIENGGFALVNGAVVSPEGFVSEKCKVQDAEEEDGKVEDGIKSKEE